MKKYLFLILALIYNIIYAQTPLQVTAKFVEITENQVHFYAFQIHKGQTMQALDITLTNTSTSDTLSFNMMTCSWEKAFSFKNRSDIYLCEKLCYSNYPIQEVLPPQESITYHAVVAVNDNFDYQLPIQLMFALEILVCEDLAGNLSYNAWEFKDKKKWRYGEAILYSAKALKENSFFYEEEILSNVFFLAKN
jgi:hypothetical protein